MVATYRLSSIKDTFTVVQKLLGSEIEQLQHGEIKSDKFFVGISKSEKLHCFSYGLHFDKGIDSLGIFISKVLDDI